MSRRSRNLRSAKTRRKPTFDPIARIDALTATGRTNWFALLAYLAFAMITTLGVEDIDFFVDSRQTQLPLVNVSIPTFSFFIFAPILGAALYVYLHLHIRKVTEPLAKTPPGSTPLEEQIKPWLLNDFVLRQRKDRDQVIQTRPMEWLAGLTTRVLVWWAGPIVLGLMWVWTWPAHTLWLSLLCGLCFMISLYAGAISWAKMRQDLGWRGENATVIAGALIVLLAIPVVWLTTANSKGIWEYVIELPEDSGGEVSLLQRGESWALRNVEEENRTWLDRAGVWAWNVLTDLAELDAPDLTAARLSVLPLEEADPETARHRYRTAFCERRGIDAEICDRAPSASYNAPPHLDWKRQEWCRLRNYTEKSDVDCINFFSVFDREFEKEWNTYRTALVESISKPSLLGKDLRRASLIQAELSRVNFSYSRLEGADLRSARMEGAFLALADMDGANFSGGFMDRASLYQANVNRANFAGARLVGADIVGAKLNEAEFFGAQLQNALLTGAEMQEAMFFGAQMQGAHLSKVNLEGAFLKYAQLQGADLSNAYLHNADFSGASLEGANLAGVRSQGTNFDSTNIVQADLSNSEFTEANFSWTQMTNTNLAGAKLKGADFLGAQLSGSNLISSRLEGVNLNYANLQSVRWTGIEVFSVSAFHADFRGSDTITQDLLLSSVGNENTLLPNSLDPKTGRELFIPSCWLSEPESWEYLVQEFRDVDENSREKLYSRHICAPGEVPQKTGTPWPLDRDPPWVEDPDWQPEDRGPVE